MTNKELIDNWKGLSIAFKTGNTIRPMTDMFLLCWGETSFDMDNEKVPVVVFDQGGEQGSPALFCQSDENDTVWAFGWDSINNCHTKSDIGKFIKK